MASIEWRAERNGLQPDCQRPGTVAWPVLSADPPAFLRETVCAKRVGADDVRTGRTAGWPGARTPARTGRVSGVESV